jgi:phosphatidylglycerol:prolipoprotein diacylglycerol transferase
LRPELFSLFGVGFPSYFVLLVTGFLFATAAGVLWARRVGQSADVVVDLSLAMLLSGVAGSRIFSVLFDGYFMDFVHLCTDPAQVDWRLDKATCESAAYEGHWDALQAVCHPGHADCLAWAKFWTGGLTFYGGFIGATVGAYFLLKRDKFPFWKAADMAGFAIPIGIAFGRVGCLLAGCCYGAPSDVPWAITFPGRTLTQAAAPATEAHAKAHLIVDEWHSSLPVHPTQIYESLACLGIAAFAYYVVHPRKRYDGQVLVAFMVLYAIARSAIEVLRRDDRGGVLGLSTSQLIGVALIVASVVIHVLRSPKVGLRARAAT